MQTKRATEQERQKPAPYLVMMRNDFPGWCARNLRLLLLIAVVVYLFSMTYPFTRVIYLITLGWALLTAAAYLLRAARRRRWLCYVLAVGVLGLAAWAFLANRAPDTAGLRRQYRACLLGTRDARYLWGGETHIGVDCSGLARTALCEAMVLQGFREGNPRLLGPQFWRFWWRDMSAQAMSNGTYGYTRRIGAVKQLAGMDAGALMVGDLAITAGGMHVLIYVGDHQWIEANPDDGRVVINRADAQSQRPYFLQPMTLHRWQFLDTN